MHCLELLFKLICIATSFASVIDAANNYRISSRHRIKRGSSQTSINQRLQHLQQAQKEEALTLQVYNADPTDMSTLCQWYGMTAGGPIRDEASTLKQLKMESCDPKDDAKSESAGVEGALSMCDAYDKAFEKDCITGLTKPQCMAVTMYTSNFYASYNEDIRKGDWSRYKVFTSLLQSAIVALDKNYPVPPNTRLYRGMGREFKDPTSKIVYFKQFVSTSLDLAVAKFFGTKTLIHFVPTAPILAAKIQGLSVYPVEEEVLISPFEAFEYLGRNGSEMYFTSSGNQEILENKMKCVDSTAAQGSGADVPTGDTSGQGSEAALSPGVAAGISVGATALVSLVLGLIYKYNVLGCGDKLRGILSPNEGQANKV